MVKPRAVIGLILVSLFVAFVSLAISGNGSDLLSRIYSFFFVAISLSVLFTFLMFILAFIQTIFLKKSYHFSISGKEVGGISYLYYAPVTVSVGDYNSIVSKEKFSGLFFKNLITVFPYFIDKFLSGIFNRNKVEEYFLLVEEVSDSVSILPGHINTEKAAVLLVPVELSAKFKEAAKKTNLKLFF